MMPEKIERHSSREERIDALRDLFPEVFTDGRVSIEQLREALEGYSSEVPDNEHYGLRWPGKQQARRLANQSPQMTLRPVPKAGLDEETTNNMVIVGDNLQVLLALQKSYASSIRLIYIDPPYNTGNDFIYKDTFVVAEDHYLQETGQSDLQGRLVSNPQTSGRFHSDWLNFMYPRLAVARTLLSDDGLLVVSIDDGEVANLRLLLDQIFGRENFIANIVWQKAYVANMTAKYMSSTHDHILVYAKNESEASVGRVPRSDEQIAKFENPDNDPRGPWKAENLSAGKYYSAGQFTIVTPTGMEVSPPNGRYWRCNEQRYNEWLADNRISFGKDGTGRPMLKKFLSEIQEGLTPDTWWKHEDAGTNKEATIELKKLFDGASVFDTPKPVRLLKRIIKLFADKDSIVMDFFAGSGTTGEAVFSINGEDGGARQCILVQFPERTDVSSVESVCSFDTIDKITCERLRRVAKAMRAEGFQGDLGFRVFKEDFPALARPLHFEAGQLEKEQLEMFSEKLAQIHPTNLFAEVLLLLGFPLDSKCDQVPQDSANTLWRFEHPRVPQRLLLCLDPEIDDDLLETLQNLKNHIFVCRDEALTDVSKARFYDALKFADSTFKVL
jgi:adenine-specific DNA-methyltransferase